MDLNISSLFRLNLLKNVLRRSFYSLKLLLLIAIVGLMDPIE